MREESFQPFDPGAGEVADLNPAHEAVAAAGENDLGRIHDAVSAALAVRVRQEGTGAVALGVEAFGGGGNIVGVGIGRSHSVTAVAASSGPPGVRALNVYVVDPVPEARVRQVLATEFGVDVAADEQVPLQIVVTGEIIAQPHTFRIRPAPGVSRWGTSRSRPARSDASPAGRAAIGPRAC